MMLFVTTVVLDVGDNFWIRFELAYWFVQR